MVIDQLPILCSSAIWFFKKGRKRGRGAYLGAITKDNLSRFIEHEQLKQPGRVIGIYFIDRASGSRFSEKKIA